MRKNIPSLHFSLHKLWSHISLKRKWQFIFLLVFVLATSFFEMIGIALVIPFLAVLSSPNQIMEDPYALPLIEAFGITSVDQLILYLTLSFATLTVLAGLLRIILLKLTIRLSFATGADLSHGIYKKTLYQPYLLHTSRNSSELINAISVSTNSVINFIIVPILVLISSTIMLVLIMGGFIFYKPFAACFLIVTLSLIYGIIIKTSQSKISFYSEQISIESLSIIKALQEGLGAIRDTLLDGSQKIYIDKHIIATQRMYDAQGALQFIGQSPRFIFEMLGALLIIILGYTFAKTEGGLVGAIPFLGALALGFQKMIPITHQAYHSWSSVRGYKSTLEEVLNLMDQPDPELKDNQLKKPILFSNMIQLKNLSFRYQSNSSWTLRNINIDITKGSCIGIVGKSGSGKSTFIDLLMALLSPSEGMLIVDGQEINFENAQSWQKNIAHVSQTIFLADASIEENIAFGVPKNLINTRRVRIAAKKAKISDTIKGWPEQYKTMLGERGVRLSGGQRQRIGIARALYKEANIIVFDEATNSLDKDTETLVMESIAELNKNLTLIIVAHNISTLRDCSQIIELSNGKVKRIVSYVEIIDKPPAK